MQLMFKYNQKKKKNPLKIFTLDPTMSWAELDWKRCNYFGPAKHKRKKFVIGFPYTLSVYGVFIVEIVCKKIEKTRKVVSLTSLSLYINKNLINKKTSVY